LHLKKLIIENLEQMKNMPKDNLTPQSISDRIKQFKELKKMFLPAAKKKKNSLAASKNKSVDLDR